MEAIVTKLKASEQVKVIDSLTGKDISKFCWAADDEAGLRAEFANDGISLIKELDDEGSLMSYTVEGPIHLIKVDRT